MKLLFDLFPVILFFATYVVYDIFVATAVLIAATLVQTLVYWLRYKRLEKIHVITLLLLLVFGGLTIVLREPEFLMWKVSVINVLIALVFFGSFFVGKITITERMMGSHVDAPKTVWNNLNWLWVAMFLSIAAINVYFALPAIEARDIFLGEYSLVQDETIKGLDCVSNSVPDLCMEAQNSEATWVNFKTFGTLGLTFLLLIITLLYISRYAKEEDLQGNK